MKTLIALVLLFGTALAQANPYYHRHHGYKHAPRVIHHHGSWDRVVVPLIIGGVVGAAIANNRAEAQTPPPVVYQPPVIVPQSANCYVVRETVHHNGTVTRAIQCRYIQ